MRKILFLILIFSALNTFSQEYINYSINTDTYKVKGLEVQPVFNDWYMSLFVSEVEKRIDWGGGIGYYRKNDLFDYSGGFKIGISKINGISAPLYGLEVDLVHNTSKVFFIGLKTAYNRIIYKDENTNFINEVNLTVKLGIRL